MMRKDWIRWCHHTPICGKNHLIGLKSLVRMTQISWLHAGGPHDTVVLPETKCIWGSLFCKNHPVIWRGDLRTPSTQGETTTSLDFAMKKLSACAPFRNTNQVDVPNVLKKNNCNDKRFKTQKRQNRKNCFDSTPDQGVTIVPGPRTAWALWISFQDVCGDVTEPSRLQHVSTVTSLNFQSASMDDKSGSVTWPSPCCWASFLANFTWTSVGFSSVFGWFGVEKSSGIAWSVAGPTALALAFWSGPDVAFWTALGDENAAFQTLGCLHTEQCLR